MKYKAHIPGSLLRSVAAASLSFIMLFSATSCLGNTTLPFPSDDDVSDNSVSTDSSENKECTSHSFGEWEMTKAATCAYHKSRLK